MSYNAFLVDDVGRTYPRKNQYIIDLIALHDAGDEKGAKTLMRHAATHPYHLALKSYAEKEKAFLRGLEKDSTAVGSTIVKQLRYRIDTGQEKLEFYKDYVDLTYDAELKYHTALKDVERLPDVLGFYYETTKALEEAKAEEKTIDKKAEAEFQQQLSTYRAQRKAELNEKNRDLKEKEREGIISKKAYRNGLSENKKHYKVSVDAKSCEGPTKRVVDKINHLDHTLKQGMKDRLKVVDEEISGIRRTTPIETTGRFSLVPFLTAPFPGLGQLFNRQFSKAIAFLVASLFIYLIAIPYGLGFGNYQGNGIAGLITLAEGGKRLDRSLIFMIEGIIALFLLAFAVLALVISFRDVYRTEKNKILGIRPDNHFEVQMKLERDGFPHLVSFPAWVIIVFIVLVPIMTAILLSFTGMDPQHQSKFGWVGIQNYAMIARGEGLAGSLFWLILAWTLIWTVLATSLQIFIGFMLALLTNNERVKGKKFFRTIFILPWAIPAFITIMFFSILLSPNGYLTELLSSFAGRVIEVKNNPVLTRAALILIQAWCGSSYVFLLTTGVLQSIPSDLYEAAEIDGASNWQRLTKITIPLVLFQTAPLLVTQYTFNFNNYSIIALFNDGGPFEPTKFGNLAGSTDILISYIYKLVMANEYQAMGAAITIVISIGLMVVAFLGYRNSQAFKEG